MKINATVTKVQAVESRSMFGGRGYLQVTCGDDVAFRVADTEQARLAYAIGRTVSIDVTPRRGR